MVSNAYDSSSYDHSINIYNDKGSESTGEAKKENIPLNPLRKRKKIGKVKKEKLKEV